MLTLPKKVRGHPLHPIENPLLDGLNIEGGPFLKVKLCKKAVNIWQLRVVNLFIQRSSTIIICKVKDKCCVI